MSALLKGGLRGSTTLVLTAGVILGAGNGTRTRDIQLGKLALYQLSYARLRGEGTLRPGPRQPETARKPTVERRQSELVTHHQVAEAAQHGTLTLALTAGLRSGSEDATSESAEWKGLYPDHTRSSHVREE